MYVHINVVMKPPFFAMNIYKGDKKNCKSMKNRSELPSFFQCVHCTWNRNSYTWRGRGQVEHMPIIPALGVGRIESGDCQKFKSSSSYSEFQDIPDYRVRSFLQSSHRLSSNAMGRVQL